MKNFEAISASLYPYDVDPFLKEKACIDEGIDTQADYTVTDKISVAKATIAILRNLIVLASESNGAIHCRTRTNWKSAFSISQRKTGWTILPKSSILDRKLPTFPTNGKIPYTLEMWYEEDASQNPDGSWIEGAHEWRVIGRCNARQNGRAQQIKGQNGDAFLYSFEVTMPADTQPIPIGTKVRIFDSRGFNIFDRSLRTEAKPKDKDTASYPVQGFYKSGQRYENTRLWL